MFTTAVILVAFVNVDAVGSYSILLILGVKLVTNKTGADDPTKENGTFLFAQVQRTGVLIGRYATAGYKRVILATTALKTIFPTISFLIVTAVTLHDDIL